MDHPSSCHESSWSQEPAGDGPVSSPCHGPLPAWLRTLSSMLSCPTFHRRRPSERLIIAWQCVPTGARSTWKTRRCPFSPVSYRQRFSSPVNRLGQHRHRHTLGLRGSFTRLRSPTSLYLACPRGAMPKNSSPRAATHHHSDQARRA